MYKTELIRRVAKETRMARRDVGDALDGVLKVVTAALREGEAVTLPGFGTFYTSNRAEGQVRNIRTGRPITIPARRVAAFRAGEVLKRTVRRRKQ